jgi:predicted aminopeptidase
MAVGSLLGALLIAVTAVCVGGGCSSVGYYGQAVVGHLSIVERSKPLTDWIGDSATDPPLRAQLQRAARIRDFAVHELALPDNRSYRRYAALDRPAAVWNVVAAPELSLTLKTWCVPVLGCIGYRGYYDRADADALAEQLRAEGWEVQVFGVPAYSTLGRTDWLGGDPLLSTFIGWPEAELARLVFHELAHQVVYVADDTAFNEAYATAVERLGGRRWLATDAGDEAREAFEAVDRRRRDFRSLLQGARADLERIYADPTLDVEARRAAKAARLQRLRDDHARLKAGAWGGWTGYDRWFDGVNNAALAIQGAYADLVPDFERLFIREGRDFARFHAAVKRLAALPKPERLATLRAVP